jgi:hypothetical protein
MRQRNWFALLAILLFSNFDSAQGQSTKLIVAYASPAATFCPGWIARREGIFAKYNLDVEMVLMQGASTYMAALASSNIQVLYGGGTAVSRAIATGGFDLTVIATETRYILPWQSGFESMIVGFHERFNPQGIKTRDAKPFLDPSFVQKAAERLKLTGK